MTDKLRECPFCGGEAFKRSYDRLIQIGCESCGYTRGFCGIIQSKIDTGVPIRYEDGKISTYEWYDKDAGEKAVEAWNTRKPMDKVVEQLEKKAELTYLNRMEERVGKKQTTGFALSIRDAIEIVKGGVE